MKTKFALVIGFYSLTVSAGLLTDPIISCLRAASYIDSTGFTHGHGYHFNSEGEFIWTPPGDGFFAIKEGESKFCRWPSGFSFDGPFSAYSRSIYFSGAIYANPLFYSRGGKVYYNSLIGYNPPTVPSPPAVTVPSPPATRPYPALQFDQPLNGIDPSQVQRSQGPDGQGNYKYTFDLGGADGYYEVEIPDATIPELQCIDRVDQPIADQLKSIASEVLKSVPTKKSYPNKPKHLLGVQKLTKQELKRAVKVLTVSTMSSSLSQLALRENV
jgi:hypothetical protein